jgi:hypothetical protein
MFRVNRTVVKGRRRVSRERRARPAAVNAAPRRRSGVRAELERRAEWTGFHDGVAEYARVIFRSPTLVGGFGRMWREGERDLLENGLGRATTKSAS